MGMQDWHTTAGDNSSAGTINWAEGQLPSTVNNSARQMMSDVRTWYEDAQWQNLGHTLSLTDSVTFKVAGSHAATYMPGRRLKMGSAQTIYGTVQTATEGGGETTITVIQDSGLGLSSTLSSVYVHAITPVGHNQIQWYSPLHLVTNGGMEIAQRGTAFSASAGGPTHLIDGWAVGSGPSSAQYNISQDFTDVPSIGAAGELILASLKATVNLAQNVSTTGAAKLLMTYLEGYIARPIIHRQFTVGFWAKSSLPGTYSLSVRNNGADRTYLGTYVISDSATWKWYEVTVPATTTSGTWSYTASIGLALGWTLQSDSVLMTAGGSWVDGNFVAVTAQAATAGTISTSFALTGVTIQRGARCLGFVSPPFNQELDRCYRYYQKSYKYETAVGTASNTGAISHLFIGSCTKAGLRIPFFTTMRKVPTLTNYSPTSGTADRVYINSLTSDGTSSLALVSTWNALVTTQGSIPGTADISCQWEADARMTF